MSTFTLANSYQFASQYIRLTPLTFATGPLGGRTGDPALSIGDWVRQTILSPPFTWRWNRGVISSISTLAGIQDYITTTGATATLTNPNSVSITSNLLSISSAGFGTTAAFGSTVLFSGFTTPALLFLNGTTGVVVSSTLTAFTCSYQHANLGATAAGGFGFIQTFNLPSFGWMEQASATNVTGVSKELQVKLSLVEDFKQNLPVSISAQSDDGAGNITFRLLPVPDQVYTLRITYQKAAPSFTATSDTWAPLPDYMFHIYNQGVLAKAYEYLGDERWGGAMQLFFKQLIGFHGGLTESQINIFMGDRTVTQLGIQAALSKLQQAVSARGLQ